jgi:hypothetical protein
VHGGDLRLDLSNTAEGYLSPNFEATILRITALDGSCVNIVVKADTLSSDHDRRLAYARDYLEKLINLQVLVPALDDLAWQ